MKLIFDIETNGFVSEATKIWCIIIKDIDNNMRNKMMYNVIKQTIHLSDGEFYHHPLPPCYQSRSMPSASSSGEDPSRGYGSFLCRGQILMKSGQILVRSGQILVKSGQILVKSGQISTKITKI